MIDRSTNIQQALRSRQRGFLLNPYRFAGGGGGPSDPDFANVRLLAHMDGTNGSTTFTDSSGTPKTMTAFDNAQISTAQSQFGGASALFDGTGDYIAAGTASDFHIATSNFCIECFVRPSRVNVAQVICGTRTASNNGWALSINNVGNLLFLTGNGGSNTTVVIGATPLTINTWVHVAADRSGSTTRIFLGGVLLSSGAAGISQQDGPLNIGQRNQTGNFQYYGGYIDEMRITIGASRYTSAFTPPTAPFPDS
jgi:hypothetical protein